MYNVNWVNELGQTKDYECMTEMERDAKIEELEAQGLEASWEEVNTDATTA
ncbi:hypothetical protein SAMN02799624_05355 [Paenibacillus sp. UNC496MF]|uniref:hypothetical protein n=1 Tax=Paenibacillus sp. UNC496MF TaxID=1502753 RepID=UPI0008DFE342|nr:hypothetical protein [Paenibacillus sp. UNC496MF]SFJ64663.1 hypothetical protein SAMN02799624_05355 [Paenibacillus sp. UNC496MF]